MQDARGLSNKTVSITLGKKIELFRLAQIFNFWNLRVRY